MVIESKESVGHTENLEEVFGILRQHKLRLNTKECSFKVESGKFLGYMITTRGIEANPNQITAIQQLWPPSNPKEVQNLTGMIVALN